MFGDAFTFTVPPPPQMWQLKMRGWGRWEGKVTYNRERGNCERFTKHRMCFRACLCVSLCCSCVVNTVSASHQRQLTKWFLRKDESTGRPGSERWARQREIHCMSFASAAAAEQDSLKSRICHRLLISCLKLQSVCCLLDCSGSVTLDHVQVSLFYSMDSCFISHQLLIYDMYVKLYSNVKCKFQSSLDIFLRFPTKTMFGCWFRIHIDNTFVFTFIFKLSVSVSGHS